LTADSRDTIKLAMGLVATMTALVLGLLVSSAKGAYDTKRSEVIQMAAKVAFLDRVLGLYGQEAAEARAGIRETVEEAVRQISAAAQRVVFRCPATFTTDAECRALVEAAWCEQAALWLDCDA